MGPMLTSGARTLWALSEAKLCRVLTQCQPDTTQPLIQDENQVSVLRTHHEIENINQLAVSEFGILMSWIATVLQAAKPWPQPEALVSRTLFKTRTEKIKPWAQPEFETLRTFTPFGPGKTESRAEYETTTFMTGIQSETGNFYTCAQPGEGTVRSWTISEADTVKLWIQTEAGPTHHWTQAKTKQIRPLTHVQFQAVRPWTLSMSDTLLNHVEMETAKMLD
ncbi:hypothetical protein P7K49_039951, partial [Saguinus oedipus]